MTVFVLYHAPDGDRCAEFTGMSQETVFQLASEFGYPFEFIDEQTYNDFLAAHP